MGELLALLRAVPTPLWSLAAAVVGSFVSWLIAVKRAGLAFKRDKLRVDAQALVSENAERAAFRAALVAEIDKVRNDVKECETAREVLRSRVNALDEQILVLRASNEIMQRWMEFFRQRDALAPGVPRP